MQESLHPLDPSPFGVVAMLRTRPEELEGAARLAVEAGVRWTREDILWHQVQPERTAWRWERYDRELGVLKARGINVLGLLCYGTPWAMSMRDANGNPDIWSLPDLSAWSDYVSAVVERYRGQIHAWEIWNEPNSQTFWHPRPDPREYARLLIAGAEAVKRADPTAWVLGCNTGDVDPWFHRAVFDEGGWGHLDIIGVHPYRPPHTPERTDMVGDLLQLASLSAERGRVKPLWITEIGIASFPGVDGASEWWQAVHVLRYYLLALASGLVEKVFWYDFRDDGSDPKEEQQNFGLLRRDWSPKPSYEAFRLMAQTLEGFEPNGRFELGADVVCLRFRRGAEERYAVWSSGKNMRRPVPSPSDRITLLKFPESPREIEAVGGWVTVDVNACPLFLVPA